MTQFKIERGIPVPSSIGRGGRESKYPFEKMRVGDSFALDNEKQLQSARNAAYLYKKSTPDFNYGAVQNDDGGGRLWRLEV